MKTTQNLIQRNAGLIFFGGNILASVGILLVTVGGSWDITNHLLNKPETFFSPPHALLYVGVAIALIGSVISFFSWRRLGNNKQHFHSALKFKLLGIALLVGAGPFDFVWHSNFGLDGLLSPPHLTLISGMILCAIGAMIGISRFIQINYNSRVASCLLILAILPVWLATTGMISSLSLPFSDTDYFDFNPNPIFAAVMATVGYPVLISLSSLLIVFLSNYRFGLLTGLGGLFLLIYGSTAIMPNFALVESVEFYSVNLIPFFIADIILSHKKSKYAVIFCGGLVGSVFYMVYYPYVMYTFNEVTLGAFASPSMIAHIYFQIMENVMQITTIPAILAGILGGLLALKVSKKITVRA